MKSMVASALLAATQAATILPRQELPVAYTGTYTISDFYFGGVYGASTTFHRLNVSSSTGGAARCSLTQQGRTIENFLNTRCEVTTPTNPDARDNWLFTLDNRPLGGNPNSPPNNFTLTIFHDYFTVGREKVFDEVGSINFPEGAVQLVPDVTAPGTDFEFLQWPGEFVVGFEAEDISDGNV